TIHNSMHIRWAATPGSSLPFPEAPTQVEAAIPPEWDDPAYDFLLETYSSHVNPIFWKLHGWIDDRVENWKVVNGVLGNDFWKGTWLGNMPSHEEQAPTNNVLLALEHPKVAAQHLAEVEQAVEIVRQSGVTHTPFAQVLVD
ncbi:MAG: hypothetical protein ACRDXF_07060, partial [Acidimicrobiia bacterium]